MQKILISSCLLGQAVRYDGSSKAVTDPLLIQWHQQGRLVSICPEVAGGLPIPRAAAEISTDKVITHTGRDVSQAFMEGANIALKLAETHDIKLALLKANSPSCGNQQIYDGSFSGTLIPGQGVTTKLLESNGIRVFNEHQLQLLAALVATD